MIADFSQIHVDLARNELPPGLLVNGGDIFCYRIIKFGGPA